MLYFNIIIFNLYWNPIIYTINFFFYSVYIFFFIVLSNCDECFITRIYINIFVFRS